MSLTNYFRRTVLVLAGGFFLVSPPLRATSPLDLASSPATPPALVNKSDSTPEAVTARRAALQKEIDRARAELEKLPEGDQEETAVWLAQEIGLLARIDGLNSGQLRTLQHAADLAKEAAQVSERLKNPRPPDLRLKPPLSLSLLDRLYAERDYLVRAKSILKTDVENATAALADARDELDAKERLRRTAKEAVNKGVELVAAQTALRLAELESRLAHEAVLLCEKALETLKFQQSLIVPKLDLLLPDFEWLQAHLVLAASDLAEAKAKQAKRLAEIDDALSSARRDAERSAQLVVAAERRAAGAGFVPDGELESRRADRLTISLLISALTQIRERQTDFVAVLQLRRSVLGRQADAAEMKAWTVANNEELERLEKSRRPQVAELHKSRQELQALRARLTDSASPVRTQKWTVDRIENLTAWIATIDRDLADITDLSTARSYLKEELSAHVTPFSWPDTLAASRAALLAAWDYEVFSVTDHPIRVKTILAVIALVLVGYWLSRKASDLIGRTLSRRLGMNVGRCTAWQTLTFYALFLVVLLVAVNLFHLSLTQFSVVSGALAVGIGFGSQTLVSNFISGIILLLERPVNKGDVIEMNGQELTVESLGPRSTLVRSLDNTQIIVPNSRLLEENVINWTLSDDVVRTRINVGVAYGSPTREVARLLEEIMLGLEEVKPDPAPLANFLDFGESNLLFEASFWSSVHSRKELESELRHRIAERFAQAGIVMAFPQREVSLATAKALRVELLPPASTPPDRSL